MCKSNLASISLADGLYRPSADQVYQANKIVSLGTREQVSIRQKELEANVSEAKTQLEKLRATLDLGKTRAQECRDEIGRQRDQLSEWFRKNTALKSAIENAEKEVDREEQELGVVNAYLANTPASNHLAPLDKLATQLFIVPNSSTRAIGHEHLLRTMLQIFQSPFPFEQKFPPPPGNTPLVPLLRSELDNRALRIWNHLTATWDAMKGQEDAVARVEALYKPNSLQYQDGDGVVVWGWWLNRLWRLSRKSKLDEGLWKLVERALYRKSQLLTPNQGQ
jgi:hypothetical protein